VKFEYEEWIYEITSGVELEKGGSATTRQILNLVVALHSIVEELFLQLSAGLRKCIVGLQYYPKLSVQGCDEETKVLAVSASPH